MGVTGSVGKTTVKEFLAAALSSAGPVLKSEGNLNTEFGVPMTWMRLQSEHKFAVIEMGMRGKGHISQLCAFAKPTAGIITSIGTAHIGELGGRTSIADAKSELLDCLPDNGFAVLPAECDFLKPLETRAKGRVLTFGRSDAADVRVLKSSSDFDSNRTQFTIKLAGKTIEGEVPGLGEHQALNAAAAIAACVGLHVDLSAAMASMSKAQIPSKRLRAVQHASALVLVDVYNSSPESCIEALRVLASAPGRGEKIAVLGDMLELGDYTEEGHRLVGAEASRLRIDRLALVGRSAHWIREGAIETGFGGRIDWVSSVEEAAKVLQKLLPGDVALVKGSRAMALERALELAEIPCE